MPINRERSSLPRVPDQKNYEYAYTMAFELAAEAIKRLPNIKEQCERCDALFLDQGGQSSIVIKYLNKPYKIVYPDIDILRLNDNNPVALRDKILILHYFTRAKGTPLSRRLITYQELQEGSIYYPSFFKRAIKPLVDHFGNQPELLLDASVALGGIRSDHGDFSVIIPAFSRVPITLVIWEGDDEFTPNGNILLDSNVLDYLNVEDINILCQTITFSLINSSKLRQ